LNLVSQLDGGATVAAELNFMQSARKLWQIYEKFQETTEKKSGWASKNNNNLSTKSASIAADAILHDSLENGVTYAKNVNSSQIGSRNWVYK
jgi:DNA relaxase NicK